VDAVGLIHRAWEALSRGDLSTLELALAPDAKWRAVEDGPWNCESRAMILRVMGRNLAEGRGGKIEDAFRVREQVVVAVRPTRHAPVAWPLDGELRYVVVTIREGLITEMKGCSDRAAALEYAESPSA
jgi:ketosteroid isomerase-like protein